MSIRPLPFRRHRNDVPESTPCVLIDNFLGLKHSNGDDGLANSMLVQHTFRISNYLCGSKIMSAHELAREYSLPVSLDIYITILFAEFSEEQYELIAKRKLTKILRSKTFKDPPISIKDIAKY